MPAPVASSREAPPASSRRRPSGWRLALVLAVQLGFLGGLLFLSACYTPAGKLTGFDVLAMPGERVQLTAKIERDGPWLLNPDQVGVEIEFLGPASPSAGKDGSPPPSPEPAGAVPAGAPSLGTAFSGGGGLARLEGTAPQSPGSHFYWVRLRDPRRMALKESATLFTLCVIPATQPIVITDIDGTISQTKAGPVLGDRPAEVEPLPGSPEALREVARSHQVVYLTARSTYLAARTRHWLAHQGFPAGPVILRDVGTQWRTFQFGAGEFKEYYIREFLKRRWPEIRWGIGNTYGDAEAYAHNGIRALILGPEAKAAAGGGLAAVRAVQDWAEVRKIVAP